LVECKFEGGAVISSKILWPCQFLDTALKTDMEQAAELALTKGTAGEDVADGGRRSSVKLTRNKSSFFTCETEIAPQAQAGSPSLRSDCVSHFFLFLFLLPLPSYTVFLAAFFAFICKSCLDFNSLFVHFLCVFHLYFLQLFIYMVSQLHASFIASVCIRF
jgi:hypothetical protein